MWLKWKLVSVHLEIVLILTQDSYMVCVECAIGLEIVWTHPIQLLGDMGHVESHFFRFGDSVSVVAQFAPNVPLAQKSFWTHPMVLLGDEVKVKSWSVWR